MNHFTGPTWHHIQAWAEEQLRRSREKNDSPDLTLEQTAALRGEIRLLKRFLDLPNQATRGVVADPDE